MSRGRYDDSETRRRFAENADTAEEALAAFLEGTLNPEERSAVAAYLARHPAAREVLFMASEALRAGLIPTSEE